MTVRAASSATAACASAAKAWTSGRWASQNRGQGSVIAPNQGDSLACEECGMCIDICPVGALTSGSYRYKTRPWEMTHTGTVCTHCGDGCLTTVGVRRSDTGSEIVRCDNRDRSGINDDFLCIKGRYAYDFAASPERVTTPLIKRDGKFVGRHLERSHRTGRRALPADSRRQRTAVDRRHRLQPHHQRRKLPAAEVRAHRAGHQQHRPPPHRRLPFALPAPSPPAKRRRLR